MDLKKKKVLNVCIQISKTQTIAHIPSRHLQRKNQMSKKTQPRELPTARFCVQIYLYIWNFPGIYTLV